MGLCPCRRPPPPHQPPARDLGQVEEPNSCTSAKPLPPWPRRSQGLWEPQRVVETPRGGWAPGAGGFPVLVGSPGVTGSPGSATKPPQHPPAPSRSPPLPQHPAKPGALLPKDGRDSVQLGRVRPSPSPRPQAGSTVPYWQCLGEGMLEGAGSSKMGSSRPLLLLQSAVEELSPVLGKRTPRAPPPQHNTMHSPAGEARSNSGIPENTGQREEAYLGRAGEGSNFICGTLKSSAHTRALSKPLQTRPFLQPPRLLTQLSLGSTTAGERQHNGRLVPAPPRQSQPKTESRATPDCCKEASGLHARFSQCQGVAEGRGWGSAVGASMARVGLRTLTAGKARDWRGSWHPDSRTPNATPSGAALEFCLAPCHTLSVCPSCLLPSVWRATW